VGGGGGGQVRWLWFLCVRGGAGLRMDPPPGRTE
jgi:hypothetical protein